MLRRALWLGLVFVGGILACAPENGGAPEGGAWEPGAILSATPACWIPPPTAVEAAARPTAARRRARRVFEALRLGRGLDALERMLEPYLCDPTRDAWTEVVRGQGFEVRREGRVESGARLALGLEVLDLEVSAVVPVERWSATAEPALGGWRFVLADEPGAVVASYVRWGDLRRGCGEGLAFRASAADLGCWSALGLEDPERCRRLEARLRRSIEG